MSIDKHVSEPQPSDPPFLFVTLLAARKAGDEMLEDLARGWLSDQGIQVDFKKTKHLKANHVEVMAHG